jgi:antitoxin (DNA-binding transcriptional repressor) of toxin-antitoxin stability system
MQTPKDDELLLLDFATRFLGYGLLTAPIWLVGPEAGGDGRQATLKGRRGIIKPMATIHISAAEAARDFAALLAQVRGGAEVIIVDGPLTVAVLHTPAPPRRSIEECIALLPENSPATIDEDFARDVAEAVAAHREPLNPPAWD